MFYHPTKITTIFNPKRRRFITIGSGTSFPLLHYDSLVLICVYVIQKNFLLSDNRLRINKFIKQSYPCQLCAIFFFVLYFWLTPLVLTVSYSFSCEICVYPSIWRWLAHQYSSWSYNFKHVLLFFTSCFVCWSGILAFHWLSCCCQISSSESSFFFQIINQFLKVEALKLFAIYISLCSSQVCGAYLTAAMYVEYWCEEKFGSLSLGDPDFSYHDMVIHVIHSGSLNLQYFTQALPWFSLS